MHPKLDNPLLSDALVLYATTKDVLISIVILMKGAFAHAEVWRQRHIEQRVDVPEIQQKSLENAISEKCYDAYRINCDYW